MSIRDRYTQVKAVNENGDVVDALIPYDWMNGPYRTTFHLAKYNNGRTPDDGEPDDVVFVSQWFEQDGTPIDDEQRIADLDAANPLPEVNSG